jgi:hypothetical protein
MQLCNEGLQESRAGRRKLRQLQGMHEAEQEKRSITLASSTCDFARDKMLYYKAIQDPAVNLDFQTTLRGEVVAAATDDEPARAAALQRAWTNFGRMVKEQTVRVCQA